MKAVGILCVLMLTLALGSDLSLADIQVGSTRISAEQPVVVNMKVEIDLSDKKNFKSLRNISIDAGKLSLLDNSIDGVVESNPVAAPIPFSSLGLSWSNLPGARHPEIFVRYSADEVDWSSWNRVVVDDHLTDLASNQFYGNLLSVPADTTHIQYSVHLDKKEGASILPLLSTMSLTLIDPGITSAVQSAESPVPAPQMLTRTDWGCPEGESSPRWEPFETDVTHIIVHHTVTSNSSTDWPASVRAIWTYHADTRGWGDIGYNFLIDPLGRIYRGRAGGDNIKGAHFSCQNNGTQGIALLGDFTSTVPTTEARQSLEELLAWIASRESIEALGVSYHGGTQLDLINIAGHRDGNASTTTCSTTACPGDAFYPQLSQVRDNVNAIIITASEQLANQQSSLIAEFSGSYLENASCYGLIEINGEILANVFTVEHGCVLFRLESPGEHQLLSDIDTTPIGGLPEIYSEFGFPPPFRGWYYFQGENHGNGNGNALWRTDGSSVEAVISDDMWIQDGLLLASGIANDRMYFSAEFPTGEFRVYSTDGLHTRIEPGLEVDEQSWADLIGSFYDKLLFVGEDLQYGLEPWIFDGSGYQLLADIFPGSVGSEPHSFLRLDEQWFFAARKPGAVDEDSSAFFKTDGITIKEIPHSGIDVWSDPVDEGDLLIKSDDAVYIVESLLPIEGPVITFPPTPTPVMRVNGRSTAGYDLGNGDAATESPSGAMLSGDALVLIGNRMYRLGEESAGEVAYELPSEWENSDFEFVGSGPYFEHAYIKETGEDGDSRVWAWNEAEAGLVMADETHVVTSADHFRHIGEDIYFYGEDGLNGRALRKIPGTVIKPVPLMGAVAGSWYDPVTSGQGFVLHPVDNDRTVYSFYSFENDGTPLWLTGLGDETLEIGQSTSIILYINSGGNFGTFNPEQVSTVPWGTLDITFDSCTKSTAILEGSTGSQTMEMVRLAAVEGLECNAKTPPKPEAAGITGSWYDPATSGQGFMLHPINDEQMVVSFYGYKENSERLWLIGLYEGQVTVGEAMVLDMIFASGGRFGAFDAEEITRTTWGTLLIEFDDCNNAMATLDGIDGQQTLNMIKLAGLQGSGLDCH